MKVTQEGTLMQSMAQEIAELACVSIILTKVPSFTSTKPKLPCWSDLEEWTSIFFVRVLVISPPVMDSDKYPKPAV